MRPLTQIAGGATDGTIHFTMTHGTPASVEPAGSYARDLDSGKNYKMDGSGAWVETQITNTEVIEIMYALQPGTLEEVVW